MADADEQAQPKLMGKRWLVFAKLTLGVGLIVILILGVNITELRQLLGSVDLYYLAVVFVIPHLAIAINTGKWQIFLRLLNVDAGFIRLYCLYLISSFFSNFLPTTVGGDAVRAYVLGRDTNNAPSVTAATFMERMIGFAALVSLVPLILFSKVATNRFPGLWVLAPGCLIGFGLVTYTLLSSKLDPLWRRFTRFHFLTHLIAFLTKTREAVYQAARSARALASTYLLSIVFYVAAAATVWAAAKSVGEGASIAYLMATVPLVLLASMLPITLNGLGITEAGFAIILQLSGVPLVEAVAVGLLLRARIWITALIGGLVFLRYRRASDPDQTDPHNLDQ